MKNQILSRKLMKGLRFMCAAAVVSIAVLGSAKEVKAATQSQVVDLIIFAGQSNMSGNGGNAALAPVVPAGQGFEYRPVAAPNALLPLVEPFGRGEGGYISDFAQFQNGTLVSAFVSTYVARTGVPVVAVSATRGGTDSSYWVSGATKSDLLSRYIKAKSFLETNGYTVRKKYLVFLQGETDAVAGKPASEYKANIISAFQPLFANGLNQVFMITPGTAIDGMYNYDDIVNAQISLCNESDLFTMGSTLLHSLPTTYLADAVHYNQEALNLVGSHAGASAAAYANGGSN